jgi:hypothetical protein
MENIKTVIEKALSEMRYEKLPDELREQLFAVEPSVCGALEYRPCMVTLRSGETSDIVYVIAAEPYIRTWGIWPEKDSGKRSIRIEDVVKIEESPCRLPARYANKLYKSGESGMGYTIFTVVFSDGVHQACVAGNAIDFIRYPDGKGPSDVAAVLPHKGRSEGNLAKVPPYYWCIFST